MMHLSPQLRRRTPTAVLALILLFAVSATASTAQEAPMHDSKQAFSHADWTTVLKRFVDDRGFVDYEGLARDRAVFDRYIRAIEEASPSSAPQRFPTRSDALAYYINAYNAHVFNGVLARGPEKKSVWRGLVSGLNFFVRMKVTVGGESMNLKSLEEKIILKQFKDPRVHAAINCASISCPRLIQEAFEPEHLDQQLDAVMREWVNDPTHLKVDEAGKKVRLNKIFDWFSGDFLGFEKRNGTQNANQIDYVNRFRSPEQQIPRSYSISFLPYNKGINAQ